METISSFFDIQTYIGTIQIIYIPAFTFGNPGKSLHGNMILISDFVAWASNYRLVPDYLADFETLRNESDLAAISKQLMLPW